MQPAGSRPRRKRLDAAARRETILAAAIPAFAAAGYDQTRVSDIAARVGVTEPVIFQNFGTKVDLFSAVLDRVCEDLARHLAAWSDECDDVSELLSRFLDAGHLDRLHTGGGLGGLFRDAGTHTAAGIRDAWHRGVARMAAAVAATLRRGQVTGSIRSDVDPTTLAWLVLSLVQAREFRRVHTTQPSPALEQEVLAAVLDVLRADAG